MLFSVFSSPTAAEWLALATGGAQFALAALGFFAAKRSRLALSLAILCLTLGGWSTANWLFNRTSVLFWNWLDVTLAPLALVGAFDLVLVFVGRSTAFMKLFGVIAAGSLILSLSAVGRLFPGSALDRVHRSMAWPLIFLSLLAVVFVVSLRLLVRHLRRTAGDEERVRTVVLLAALWIGVTTNATELFGALGVEVLRLGTVGSLVAALLLWVAVARLRLLETPLLGWKVSTGAGAVALANLIALMVGAAFVAPLLLPSRGHTEPSVVLMALLSLVLLSVAGTRMLTHVLRELRARMRFAWLGRLSAQMAHDLNNPLMSMSATLDYLQEERRRGRPLEAQVNKLDQLQREVQRLSRSVETYRRFGSMQLRHDALIIEPLFQQLADFSRRTGNVDVELKPPSPSLAITADVDLVRAALENLVRNALDAMPEGGCLVLQAVEEDKMLELTVADSGRGMSQRELDVARRGVRTEGDGTGLGLAFVQQVAVLHRGKLTLSSRKNEGTRATMALPLAP